MAYLERGSVLYWELCVFARREELIMCQPYWLFIDWTRQWDFISGVPKAIFGV